LGVLFQNKAYKQEFARNFTPEGQKPAWEEESAMKDLERKFTEFVIRTVGKDLSHEESKD
jgi:hypothetical protein